MSAPIYVTDNSGQLINLSELYDRVAKLEKFFPKDFSLPKSRRRKKSEAVKVIEQSLRKTMFK